MTKRTPIKDAFAKMLQKLNVNILLGVIGLGLAVVAFAFDLFGFRVDRQDNETTSKDLATLIEDIRVNARPRIVGLVDTKNPYAIPLPGNGEIALRMVDEHACTASWIDKDAYMTIGVRYSDKIETVADLLTDGYFFIEIFSPSMTHFVFHNERYDKYIGDLPHLISESIPAIGIDGFGELSFKDEVSLLLDGTFDELDRLTDGDSLDIIYLTGADCGATPFLTLGECWVVNESRVFTYQDFSSLLESWTDKVTSIHTEWDLMSDRELINDRWQVSQRKHEDVLKDTTESFRNRASRLAIERREFDEENRLSKISDPNDLSDTMVIIVSKLTPEPFIPEPWIPSSSEDRFTLTLSPVNMVRALQSLPLCLELKGKDEIFLVRMSDSAVLQGLSQKDYEDMKRVFEAPSLLRDDGTLPEFILDEKALRFYYVDDETGQERWLNGDLRR